MKSKLTKLRPPLKGFNFLITSDSLLNDKQQIVSSLRVAAMNNILNRCLWNSSQNELHIDIGDLLKLNHHRILVLTSWNHSSGITLSLVTDDGIDRYDNPFTTLPYFPILEKLDYNSCKDYIDQIPFEIQNVIKRYRRDSCGIVMLLSQNIFLTDLYGKYSTLFWLLFKQAKAQQWTEQQFVNRCLQHETVLLQQCHLPANAVAFEVLAKLTANSFGQYQYDLIFRLFEELDYHHLNSVRKDIPDHLIQFLLRHSELQHLKLIHELEQRYDYNELLRAIRAIQHLAVELKIDSVNVTKQVLESDSISALKTLQAHLREEATHQLLLDYAKIINDESGACPSFPSPPLAATADIVAITSAAELLAESQLLRHDLVRYCNSIVDGHYYAYHVLAPERSTLLLYLFQTADDGIVPVIKEVVTYSGQSANAATIEQIRKWINRHSS